MSVLGPNSRAAAEDVVQETFIGFLTSLPNYDTRRPLESYLFSIAAHKLTDHLRREGRRPTVPLVPSSSRSGSWDLPGTARPASSILRSGERRRLEETALVEAMREQIERWRRRGEWQKLACIELLLVRGWANKEVAVRVGHQRADGGQPQVPVPRRAANVGAETGTLAGRVSRVVRRGMSVSIGSSGCHRDLVRRDARARICVLKSHVETARQT